MITPELVTYIKQNLAAGKSRQEIQTTLLNGGSWHITDINEGFAAAESTPKARSKWGAGKIILLIVGILIILPIFLSVVLATINAVKNKKQSNTPVVESQQNSESDILPESSVQEFSNGDAIPKEITATSNTHIYKNTEYGFYFDLPGAEVEVTDQPDQKHPGKSFLFHLKNIKGVKSDDPTLRPTFVYVMRLNGTDPQSAQNIAMPWMFSLMGATPMGTEVVNGGSFDHYRINLPNNVAYHVYVSAHNGMYYMVMPIHQGDLKYFGFL